MPMNRVQFQKGLSMPEFLGLTRKMTASPPEHYDPPDLAGGVTARVTPP
jgi:hypothetical protein